MNKKIIIGIVAALVVIGGTVGTVLGVQAYNTNKEYEQLAQNVADCKRMIKNINYVFVAEDDNARQAHEKRDLDTLAKYEESIEAKNMSEDEKSKFAEYCKLLKQNFEQCKLDTKTQLDGVQVSKDAHTDEGYYTDEFNNEWNGFINQFNENYNNEKYYDAFKVVLTMQNKLNEYVATKTQEAADKAEAERQTQEAEAAKNSTVKQGMSSKRSGSSSSSSKSSGSSNGGSSYSGSETDNGDSNTGASSDIQEFRDSSSRALNQMIKSDQEAEAEFYRTHPNATGYKRTVVSQEITYN